MDVSVDGANLLPRQSTTAFTSLSFQRAIREDKQCKNGVMQLVCVVNHAMMNPSSMPIHTHAAAPLVGD